MELKGYLSRAEVIAGKVFLTFEYDKTCKFEYRGNSVIYLGKSPNENEVNKILSLARSSKAPVKLTWKKDEKTQKTFHIYDIPNLPPIIL